MDFIKESFLWVIGFVFQWIPMIHDFMLVSVVPAGYAKVFDIVMIIVIVSVVVWAIQAMANKILLLAIIVLFFPYLTTTITNLNIPGLSGMVKPMEQLFRGTTSSSGVTNSGSLSISSAIISGK